MSASEHEACRTSSPGGVRSRLVLRSGFGGRPEQFTGPTDCLPDVEPPGQGLDRRHRRARAHLRAFAPGERVSRECAHTRRLTGRVVRQAPDGIRFRRPPFLRYLVLNDSRNDVISTAHLSAEYVGDASDQRMKRASIREVTWKCARRLEGRLIAAPPLSIQRSRVRIPSSPPTKQAVGANRSRPCH